VHKRVNCHPRLLRKLKNTRRFGGWVRFCEETEIFALLKLDSKDPRQRLQAIGEAPIVIEGTLAALEIF
jgi:hypothetical protein